VGLHRRGRLAAERLYTSEGFGPATNIDPFETGDKHMETLAEQDRDRLIRAVQAAVPLVERPFAQLADELELSETDVIDELGSLQAEGILREISAVLEGSALQHDSALVAGRVEEELLDRVVEVVNAHPTVTHNYLRNHDFNLWFTIAVPPGMSLDRTLELLAEEAGVQAFRPLRRTHTFKIGVNFDPKTMMNRTAATHATSVEPLDPSARERAMLRAMQTPLEIGERPFDALADVAETTAAQLLAFARSHLGGVIRRYVGTLRHRKLGVRENGMVVWRVSDDRVEDVGTRLARAPEVSHCYAREVIEGFPYNVYSMVHGASREACHELAEQLSKQAGQDDYAVLFSEREFKKTRLRYYLPELDEWWTARAGSG
jgi:DNA-binding Lrp family transcriptional regulator